MFTWSLTATRKRAAFPTAYFSIIGFARASGTLVCERLGICSNMRNAVGSVQAALRPAQGRRQIIPSARIAVTSSLCFCIAICLETALRRACSSGCEV